MERGLSSSWRAERGLAGRAYQLFVLCDSASYQQFSSMEADILAELRTLTKLGSSLSELTFLKASADGVFAAKMSIALWQRIEALES